MNYIVNENHILSLRMPDHKVIFWNESKKGWSILWWDNKKLKIISKNIRARTPQIICPECDVKLVDTLNRHWRRKHPDLPLPKKSGKNQL